MANCYKTSNNKWFSCPPRMDDARHFTDYRPNCHMNNLVRTNNEIVNSYDYRQFLTRNADKLIDLNRAYAVSKNGCGPCMVPYNTGTMLPEQNLTVCNERSCNNDVVEAEGLGTGRWYSNTMGACANWPSTIPINQPSNCCAPSNKLFNYYDQLDGKIQGANFPRLTVPSGGLAGSGGDPVPFNF
jgi:hypothetical protein